MGGAYFFAVGNILIFAIVYGAVFMYISEVV